MQHRQCRTHCGKLVIQQLLQDQGVEPPSLLKLTFADWHPMRLLISLISASLPTSMQKMLIPFNGKLNPFSAPANNFEKAMATLKEKLELSPVILGVRNKIHGNAPHWVLAYAWRDKQKDLAIYDTSPRAQQKTDLLQGNTSWSTDELENRWLFPRWATRLLKIITPGEIPSPRFGLTCTFEK